MSKIALGKTPQGKVIYIDLKILLRTRLLLQANSGGGKSWGIRRLVEQLFGKVQIIILDREGEFASLCDKYDFLLVGDGHDIPADIRSARMLAEKLLEHRASAICDLYEAFRTSSIRRMEWVREFLLGLVDAPKSLWHDVVVIVDEAHLLCPQVEPKGRNMEEREIISGCKEAMIALATVGRKRGQCAVWATQRLAKLDKDASAELFNRMVGMTMEDTDVDRAIDLMSVGREDRLAFRKSLRELEPGQFYVFGRAVANERTLMKFGPVETHHQEAGNSKGEYEPPAPSEKVKALLAKLADLPQVVEAKAKTEKELRAENSSLKQKLAASLKLSALLREATAAPSKPVIQKVQVPIETRVEVPVLKESELKRLERIAEKVTSGYEGAAKAADAINHSLVGIRGELGKLKIFEKHQDDRIREAHDAFKSARPAKAQHVFQKPPPKMEYGALPPVPGGVEPLSPLQIRQLVGLLEFERIGIPRVDRQWLSGWLGMSLSGHFKNEFGKSHKLGLIGYDGPMLFLTDEGRQVAPASELEISGPVILERCVSAVSDLSGRQLRHLHLVYPEWVSREQLAEQLGMSLSGHFKNEFGHLHKAGMVDYGSGEHKMKLRCADWLFVERPAGVA